MPGAWEILKNPRVLVGILSVETTTMAWAFGLRKLQFEGGILPIAGQPFDHARNSICKVALEHGFEWVFMLDSDVILPPDAIQRLLSHRKPLISGVYHRRSPPVGIPVMIKNGSWVTSYPQNQIIEVDYVGSGAFLIHRSVLERMAQECPVEPGRPWFCWNVDKVGIVPEGWNLSEDFVFCKQAKERLGIPILVDTGVQALHVGFSQVTYNKMDALHCVP